MAKEKVIDLAWKLGTTLLVVGVAYATMQGAVTSLQHDKLDSVRFVADSINTVRTLNDIQDGVQEANGRLREIQCGLPARPGCR